MGEKKPKKVLVLHVTSEDDGSALCGATGLKEKRAKKAKVACVDCMGALIERHAEAGVHLNVMAERLNAIRDLTDPPPDWSEE